MNPPWVTYQEIGGKQEHSEIAVTTYYPGVGSRGGLVEPPKLIFTNVSKRAVSDEKLRTNHCDTCNALKIVCLCLLNMKRAKIT